MTSRHIRRALRNLGLAGLAALVIWSMKGYPLPMEMAFRQYERQSLAERSEILWTYKGTRAGARDTLAGLAEDAVHVWHPNGYILFWPRREGGTLVPLPEEFLYQDITEAYTSPAFLVLDPPEGADAARLTISLRYNQWSEDYVVEGERQGQAFFFWLKMRHLDDANDFHENNAFHDIIYWRANPQGLNLYPYTLEFFDAAGQLLSTVRQVGTPADGGEVTA